MNCAPDSTFPVALVSAAHDLAEQNCKRTTASHTKELYLRTLAAYAVHYYFNCLGIPAQYGSGMTDPRLFILSQSVDVLLPEVGQVECLAIFPNDQTVEVPPEVWGDRIAYIAVQLDESLKTATLVGYMTTVDDEEIPVTQFRQHSIEDLLAYLDQLQRDQLQHTHRQQDSIRQVPVQLSQWFNNVFEQGWQLLEQGRQLFDLNLNPPQHAYRSSRYVHHHGLKPVVGQKVLDLKIDNTQIELSLALIHLNLSEIEIRVWIYPGGTKTDLPVNLQAVILDEFDQPLDQTPVKTKDTTKEYLRFRFSGEPGERFSICLTLDDVAVTEAFVI